MRRNILVAVGAVVAPLVLYLTVATLTPPGQPVVSQRTIDNMTMKAVPPSVRAGQTIRLSLTVSGPAKYGPAEYNTCRPVWFWAEDARGKRAWTEVQFWACASNARTETIPAGETMTFSVDWSTSRMVPGRYTVRGNFGLAQPPPGGNIPPVTIEIKP
jgi:hypothetical protein